MHAPDCVVPAPRAVPVSADQLRTHFAAERILERAANHTLREQCIADRAAPPEIGPIGTRSQIVRYSDPAGTTVAEAHQYLLPDGSIGASGMPDPKFVLVNGIGYYTI